MSNLKLGQLAELTERVRARLAEFGEGAFDLPSLGVIRLVYDVIEEWHEESTPLMPQKADAEDGELLTIAYVAGVERGKAIAKPVEPERLATMSAPAVEAPATNGNGQHHSEQATAALGPEHTVVTPLQDDAIADSKSLRMGSEEKAAELRSIVNELRMLSAHGEMPSMAEWDEKKPDDLPRAATLCQRHKLSWGRLAEYADLTFDLNERKSQGARKSVELRRHGTDAQ